MTFSRQEELIFINNRDKHDNRDETNFIMARQNRRQQDMESDSESDDAGHGNQDQPAVDDRKNEEEEDDPATTLGT